MTGVLDYKHFWTNIESSSFKLKGEDTTTTTTTTPATTTTKKPVWTFPPRRTRPPPTTRRTRPTTTTRPFPTTPKRPSVTPPPYDAACEEDGPDCLVQLQRDETRKFCEIEGWKDYCPQLCCYKVKGAEPPFLTN